MLSQSCCSTHHLKKNYLLILRLCWVLVVASNFVARELLRCSMWDLVPWPRDCTPAPCVGHVESQPLNHQGSPLTPLLDSFLCLNNVPSHYSIVTFCFIYPFICWWTWVVSFFFLAVMKNGAVNIRGRVFMWVYVFISFGCGPRSVVMGS